MDNDGQIKINYQRIAGFESTAYVEESKNLKGLYVGEDKYSEDPVSVVRGPNGFWLEVR